MEMHITTSILPLLLVVILITGIQANCSVCGRDKRVGNGKAIYIYPNNKNVTCSELEEAGIKGLIKLEECAFYPFRIYDLCECHGALRGQSPVSSQDDDYIPLEETYYGKSNKADTGKNNNMKDLIPQEGDDDDEGAEIPHPRDPEKAYELPRLGDDDATEMMV